MLKKPLLYKYCILFILLLALVGCEEDEMGVYSLENYQSGWKGNVGISDTYDPGGDFWTIMTSGSDPECAALNRSRRYRNHEVVIQTIIPVPGDSRKHWDQFDLVFFYGHHNTIVPPHPHDTFSYSNYVGGSWVSNSGYLDLIGWGHTTPYDYYPTRPITNANSYPGAVTYLYNQYTSSLLGGNYDYGGGTRSWHEHWNDPVQSFNYGELGDIDLEWLILYGCQAVITANEDGSYNPLAYRCFMPVSGKYHIIMGHYISYYTYQMEPLASFAYDLLAKVPIQQAYFDTDPDNNTSAIAAEKSPFPGWAASVMENDRWRDPMEDNEDACTFTQRWIVPAGWVASHRAAAPVAAAPAAAVAQNMEQAPPQTESLDLKKIEIKSPEVRKLLKADTINVRNPKTYYLPTGALPDLKTETPKDGVCKEQLETMARKLPGFQKGKIKSSAGIYTIEGKEAAGWISRHSGSFKLTRTAGAKIAATQLSESDALRKALHYVAAQQWVGLSEGEEMDVIFVSVVKNALTVSGDAARRAGKKEKDDGGEDTAKFKLVEEFKSHYYVGFGRRYNGVPVIGSRLVVRMDAVGEPVMVTKNWRKIAGLETARKQTETTARSVEDIKALLIKDPVFRQKFKPEGDKKDTGYSAADIKIVNLQCGYMEAPVNYKQDAFVLGAVVGFKVGKTGEGYSQLVIPLRDVDKGKSLWGKR